MAERKRANKTKETRDKDRADECGRLAEADTLSASLDLEDIINDYDCASKRSTSLASNQNLRQQSSSYFSAVGAKDDETTSFYSALQDGFSLSEFAVPDSRRPPRGGRNIIWSDTDFDERDTMLLQSHFQVLWHGVSFKIEPKVSLSGAWNRFEQTVRSSLQPVTRLLTSSRTYNCNNDDSGTDSRDQKNETITILQQISGSFNSGELIGIIGPSGAGKTSLLNFLSRRREDGYTGQLYVEGANRRIKISTIPQHDSQPEYLTVRENLVFASRLKNPHPNCDHEKSIANVSNLLGLDNCLDTRTKKISGGQQKRLGIAQELLSRPDILILDEPTSGLDSTSCYNTLTVLKDLVIASAMKKIDPIAIVLTIHQPEQEALELFDKIYVMASNGIAIYNGPPDSCTQFIEKHTGLKLPDDSCNPATFLIEIASGEFGDQPIKALENQVKIEFTKGLEKILSNSSTGDSEDQQASGQKRRPCKLGTSLSPIGKHFGIEPSKQSLYVHPDIAKSGFTQGQGHFLLKTRILGSRFWISTMRDPKQMIGRVLIHIMLPIFVALLIGSEPGRSNGCPNFRSEYKLSELVDEKQTSDATMDALILTYENIATFFIVVYSLCSASVGITTLVFTLDLQRSLKEVYNGWYSMNSYLVARILTDLPLEILLPSASIIILYPTTGQETGPHSSLWDGYRIAGSAVAIILCAQVARTLGMMIGAIYLGHLTTALFVSQGVMFPFVFLSGFVARIKSMTTVVYGLSFTSIYRHAMEAAILFRYGFNICGCKPSDVSHDVKLTGVPDRLRSFTQFWIDSQKSVSDEVAPSFTNKTNDIFDIFTKQISLYNTFGVTIRSCDDMVPFQLIDLSLREEGLITNFISLAILLLVAMSLLFLTLKIVIRSKRSL